MSNSLLWKGTLHGLAHTCFPFSRGQVLRNEALLLLASLARGHEEIAKIAVFEGAFDRLFNVVREEGASDGGILVQVGGGGRGGVPIDVMYTLRNEKGLQG